tara:strand:- start:650 stop:1855 length:1206 start_codon:yes stop_codon:yes gene_type:complete
MFNPGFQDRTNKPRRHVNIRHRSGFSLVEMLVVISIIGILVGLTLTALSGVDGTEQLLRSRNNLRQIHTWMENYSNNHRDRIVPSQFDYLDENGTELGKIASAMAFNGQGGDLDWLPTNNLLGEASTPRDGLISQGTFADILWVETNLADDVGVADFPLVVPGGGMNNGPTVNVTYKYRAPNRHIYDYDPNFKRHPLRSFAPNTHNFPRFQAGGLDSYMSYDEIGEATGSGIKGYPKPFGAGAYEKGLPGFFAANNFFDARSKRDKTLVDGDSNIDRYVTMGQLTSPASSMYLVDSFAGTTIGGGPDDELATSLAFLIQDFDSVSVLGQGDNQVGPSGASTQEVDLRYGEGESCLMLFLDGHTDVINRFGRIQDLQGAEGGPPGRGIRITDLDRRKSEINP